MPSPHLALTEMLKSLGLTKYEALVYIGLLKEPGATATRIHEVAGSRAHRCIPCSRD